VTFAAEENESAKPESVGFFGAQAVAPTSANRMNLIQQSRVRARGVAIRNLAIPARYMCHARSNVKVYILHCCDNRLGPDLVYADNCGGLVN